MTFRTSLSILLFSLGLAFLLPACVPPPEETYEGILVDLNNETTQQLYEHQNNRAADSLLLYLKHPNPSYRYQAARALGSFPTLDRTARVQVASALADRQELVRAAAAYALGQTGDERDAQRLAAAFDTLGEMVDYNAEVLAAVGKIGSERHHDQVVAISTYQERDTTLRVGQLRSLFYFARQGVQSAAGDSLVLQALLDESAPEPVRQEAAFFLQRFPVAVSKEQESKLRRLLRNVTEAMPLMAIASTLGHAGLPTSRVAMLRALRDADDWRVRVELLRSLKKYDYTLVREGILQRLSDEHPLVRRAAADQLLARGDVTDATFYHRFGKDSTHLEIRYALFGAANRHLPKRLTDYRSRINYDLQQAFAGQTTVFEKRDILLALAEFPWNYRTIYDLYRDSESPVVRSAAAEALSAISRREDFDEYFRNSAGRVRLDLATYFQEMITTLEVGPSFHAANAFVSQPDVYRPLIIDRSWLQQALDAYKLPKEIEAYYAVDAAAAALAGKEEPAHQPPPAKVNPINWDLLGQGGQDIQVRTSAGRFTLRLYPDIAPATASNFLQLAQSEYYAGKHFHRVVPNFVAQGGGPLGDGFGAETNNIRTETPGIRWDRAGLVGVASAGKDTEGVQFFITHRPTPHLDGNYTIFGEVTQGQDIVDQINVGTEIEAIIIR